MATKVLIADDSRLMRTIIRNALAPAGFEVVGEAKNGREAIDMYFQFKPDVVAVSAGFDAQLYDLLLQLRVTESSFFKIGQRLRERSQNIFATLEGGYNVAVLPQCVYNFMAGINGEAMPHLRQETSSSRAVWEEYELRIQAVMSNLRPWWKFS